MLLMLVTDENLHVTKFSIFCSVFFLINKIESKKKAHKDTKKHITIFNFFFKLNILKANKIFF
jgi:hypothetical protein